MQQVTHQVEHMDGRHGDRPALMLVALPVAALLWLLIITAAFELFQWATTV